MFPVTFENQVFMLTNWKANQWCTMYMDMLQYHYMHFNGMLLMSILIFFSFNSVKDARLFYDTVRLWISWKNFGNFVRVAVHHECRQLAPLFSRKNSVSCAMLHSNKFNLLQTFSFTGLEEARLCFTPRLYLWLIYSNGWRSINITELFLIKKTHIDLLVL